MSVGGHPRRIDRKSVLAVRYHEDGRCVDVAMEGDLPYRFAGRDAWALAQALSESSCRREAQEAPQA